MTQELPFRDTYSVVLDANGQGSIRFSPSQGTWTVKQVAASVTSNANEPTFVVTINGAFVGGSYSGSQTSDTTFDQILSAQESLVGLWTGGDPGASATMTLSGVKTV